MSPCHIQPASPADAPAMMALIAACRDNMRTRNLRQWVDQYPTLDIVQRDADSGSLYVLRDPQNTLLGGASLDEKQPDAYRTVPWTGGFDQHVLCVHRLAIHPDCQRRGLARQLMAFAEDLARTRRCAAVRLDTYSANPVSLAFYQSLHYHPRGTVHFPLRDLPFICMEKLLA